MTETKKELQARIREFQKALYFWLPCIPDERDGGPKVSPRCVELIEHDAWLLTGLDDCEIDTAESMGWIELLPDNSRPDETESPL